MNDRYFMTRAWHLAMKGKGKTSPNPMVGAVIVKNGRIVAEGWHRRCGGPHAEAMALRKAGEKAHGATMYVTLEPCQHFGRTPPCTDAILAAGIRKVVVGMKDPNPVMNGKSLNKLRRAGLQVKCGILEKELARMNAAFIKYIRFHRPLVVAKFAQTLDGKIASSTGQSKWLTSSQTRRWARQQRTGFDAIMVGIGTVLADNPRLNAAGPSHRLKKVVVDSRLRIPLHARLFRGTHPQDCFIATTKAAPAAKQRSLGRKAVVIVCPQKNRRIDLRWLMQELARREITSVLIEGGAHLIGSALEEKLIDKMHIYLAPKIMGDEKALSSVVGRKVDAVDETVHLKDVELHRIGNDIFIEGTVQY